MRRTPLYYFHLEVDAKKAKHRGRGTPIHNADALEEGIAGHQGMRCALHLVGVRRSRACEELEEMLNYPPVWATMKRPSFGEGA